MLRSRITISLPFPSQNALGEFVAAECCFLRDAARESADEQHVLVQLAAWNLEEQRVAEPMSSEEPVLACDSGGYDLGVWLEAGVVSAFSRCLHELQRAFSAAPAPVKGGI